MRRLWPIVSVVLTFAGDWSELRASGADDSGPAASAPPAGQRPMSPIQAVSAELRRVETRIRASLNAAKAKYVKSLAGAKPDPADVAKAEAEIAAIQKGIEQLNKDPRLPSAEGEAADALGQAVKVTVTREGRLTQLRDARKKLTDTKACRPQKEKLAEQHKEELAAYAALDKRVTEARGLLSKAYREMAAVSRDADKLKEVQDKWQQEVAAAAKSLEESLEQVEKGETAGAGSVAAGTADEWPGWLGPNRDGKSPDKGLLKEWPEGGPKLLWKADNLGKGYSSVAVSGQLVYVTGDTGGQLVLYAFDLEGKGKWTKVVDKAWTGDHPGSRSAPVIHRGLLYLVSGNGVVACVDAATGRPKWMRQMKEFGGGVPGWGYAESVLIFGNLAVVTPGGASCIVALDQATGKTIWQSTGFRGGAQYGSCIGFKLGQVPTIVAGTHSGLVGVDARTGRALWHNGFSSGNTANCPTPAYADGYVFWANGYGKGGICMKLSPAGTATEAWTTRDMVCHHGGYVIHEGYIYGNNGGGWACLDLKTGQKKWSEGGVGKGSLCWADGMLYLFGEDRGKVGLATCSPDGMEMKGTFQVEGSGPSWAHPVVIGGRLYLRYDKNLYCFDVKAK